MAVRTKHAARAAALALLLALSFFVGGAGAVAYRAFVAEQRAVAEEQEPEPLSQEGSASKTDTEKPVKADRFGDPLPEGAVSRLGTTRLRHGGLTTALEFAPDSKSLFTMGVDGLRIWDVATGKPLHHLANQEGRNLNPGFLSPDGTQVVTVDLNHKNQLLRLREVATGQLVREFGGHPCVGACFSPDGSKLATMGTSQPGDLRCRAFVNVISLWDLATGQRINSWTGHKDGVYCGLFTADGKTLITGGGDKAIRFWDVASGREVRQLHASSSAIGHLALSHDGKLLAAIALRKTLPGGAPFPSGLAWHADNNISIWDLTSGKEVQQLTLPEPERPGVSGFTAAAFAPDGKTFVTGGVDQFARLWDLATGKELRRYDLGHNVVWTLALSPDGKTLAGLPGGTTVRLIDMASGNDFLPLEGHRNNVRSTFLTPDNRTAITAAAGERAVVVWNLETGQEQHRLEGHDGIVAGLIAAGDGRMLYSLGYEDRSIVVWDLLTRKPLRRLEQPRALTSPPLATALSPDGKTLALASLLIDTATGKEIQELNADFRRA